MNDHLYDAFDSELVIVGADTTEGLVAEIGRLIGFLEQAPSAQLEDVAYTCVTAARGKRCVLSVVADDTAELLTRLRAAVRRIAGGAARVRDKSGTYYFREHVAGPGTNGKVAFLFPGATSFYPDMLRDLAILFPVCRQPFDELEEAMAGSPVARNTGFSPAAFVFPPSLCYRHDADAFSAGGYAQGIVSAFAANFALDGLFRALGVRPDGVFGFSGGDISALAASGAFGAFNHVSRVKFLREYYELVDRAVDRAGLPKCVMVSVISPRPGSLASALAEYTADQAAVAFNQSPRQHTVALAPEIAEAALRGFSEAGIRALRLPVDRPFNTPWCANILPELRKFAKTWVDFRPQTPLYSCATARPMEPGKVRHIRDDTAEQWTKEIRFEETVQRMAEDGYRVFLEIGPRGSMCGAIDDILRGRGCMAVAANRIHRSGLTQMHHALGALAALGVPVDAAFLHARRRRHLLDLDAPLMLEVKADAELRLECKLPQLVLFSNDTTFVPTLGPRVGKAAERQVAVESRNRRLRQYDFGALAPLISDHEVMAETPGISIEIAKTIDLKNFPFLRDYAYGTSQLAYSESLQDLRGFLPLPLSVGAEMMAELAQTLVPKRHVVRIDDLQCRHQVSFARDQLKVFMRAERVSSPDPSTAAVKVQLRVDSPNSAYTWPVMEGTFFLSEKPVEPVAFVPKAMPRPRNVHWEARDIYPERLHYGAGLQCIERADVWSEAGLDYSVSVPEHDDVVKQARMPIFVVDPMLFEAVFSGFPLWRSHELFGANFGVIFRLKRLDLHVASFTAEQQLNCYLRLSSFTPQSLIGDIAVSDGKGNLIVEIEGLEQLTERVPRAYRQLVLSPAATYLTEELPECVFGSDAIVPIAGALVSDPPYAMFERNEEFWLRVISNIVLGRSERRDLERMTGTVRRRAEWLFGRVAAKETVRRFMQKNYQARWAAADVTIWPDDSGKPHPIGEWSDFLSSKLDLTIAHTSRLVVAAAAPSARIGIDVEALGRDLSIEFTNGVFDADEKGLAESLPGSTNAYLRFWCAKESVSKALGTGIRYSPKDLLVSACDPESGRMEVTLKGQWLEAFRQFTGRPIPVRTSIVRDHMLASCVLPASLFGELNTEENYG